MTDLANPPTIEPTGDWLTARRMHLLQALESDTPARRRRTWRIAAVALAVLLLAGAAVAATGYTLFDWLHSGNPGEARFSIDATRTVDWPAPESLACESPGSGEFDCAAGASGKWQYELFGRVEAQTISRETALAALAQTESAGGVSHEQAERIRAQIAAVSNEFFEKLNLLAGFNSVASPHEVRPGVILVPPGDVPQFVVCRPDADAFACEELAASADVPVGAPFYGLRENEDWVEKPYRPTRTDFGAMLESVFGRKLTPAEIRVLITFTTPATTEGGASGATVARPTTTGG
jgi:hypothetical protein